MQQNYIDVDNPQLPNLSTVKRSIEFQNYQFNQKQIQSRQQILKRQKLQEIQRQLYNNKRALIQLENAKLKQLQKKYQVQDTLQKQYDRQINTQHRMKTQQKSYDKLFAQRQKEMLQNYQKNRIVDLAKLYHVGSNKMSGSPATNRRKLLTQGCEDSLDDLRNQSPQFLRQNHQRQTPNKYQSIQTQTPVELQRSQSISGQKYNFPEIQKPSLQNSRLKKYSVANLDYANYLKKQIQRKQKIKQQQRRRQLQKDRTWIQRQNLSYSEHLQTMSYLNQKKKYDYANGLQKQIFLQRQYRKRL